MQVNHRNLVAAGDLVPDQDQEGEWWTVIYCAGHKTLHPGDKVRLATAGAFAGLPLKFCVLVSDDYKLHSVDCDANKRRYVLVAPSSKVIAD